MHWGGDGTCGRQDGGGFGGVAYQQAGGSGSGHKQTTNTRVSSKSFRRGRRETRSAGRARRRPSAAGAPAPENAGLRLNGSVRLLNHRSVFCHNRGGPRAAPPYVSWFVERSALVREGGVNVSCGARRARRGPSAACAAPQQPPAPGAAAAAASSALLQSRCRRGASRASPPGAGSLEELEDEAVLGVGQEEGGQHLRQWGGGGASRGQAGSWRGARRQVCRSAGGARSALQAAHRGPRAWLGGGVAASAALPAPGRQPGSRRAPATPQP